MKDAKPYTSVAASQHHRLKVILLLTKGLLVGDGNLEKSKGRSVPIDRGIAVTWLG
jgi:hypothetical protein